MQVFDAEIVFFLDFGKGCFGHFFRKHLPVNFSGQDHAGFAERHKGGNIVFSGKLFLQAFQAVLALMQIVFDPFVVVAGGLNIFVGIFPEILFLERNSEKAAFFLQLFKIFFVQSVVSSAKAWHPKPQFSFLNQSIRPLYHVINKKSTLFVRILAIFLKAG